MSSRPESSPTADGQPAAPESVALKPGAVEWVVDVLECACDCDGDDCSCGAYDNAELVRQLAAELEQAKELFDTQRTLYESTSLACEKAEAENKRLRDAIRGTLDSWDSTAPETMQRKLCAALEVEDGS